MTIIIQILLILAVTWAAFGLARARRARSLAVRKLVMLLFGLLAALSILFPSLWEGAARILGVGRGTDLVLYALVVAFLVNLVATSIRFRDSDARFTALARRMALTEAGPAVPASVEPATVAPDTPAEHRDTQDEPA